MEVLTHPESELKYPQDQSPAHSLDRDVDVESGLSADEGEIREDSPVDLPTLASVVVGSRPPFPSEVYTSYTQLNKRITDVLNLVVVQPQLNIWIRSLRTLLRTSCIPYAWLSFHL